MASNKKRTNASATLAANAITAILDNGYIKIYQGTQPATADTALSGLETLLATLRFGTPAFPSAVNGIATANAITSETNAPNTGTAQFFRVLKSDGTTVVFDGNISTAGADLNMNNVSIIAGQTVNIVSFVFTELTS